MTQGLTWTIDSSGDGATIATATGKVTGDADFSEIVAHAANGPLRLHLGGITQINSTGVREWILFMRALAEQPHPTELTAVSATLVRQLNMIANFGGDATITSVELPYYCDSCGHEQQTTLDLSGDRTIPSSETCAACGKVAEFDDIAESYLAFLTR